MTAMMTTAAVDVHSTVTVKQHGFHVRQPFQPGLGEAAPTVGGCGAQLSLELGALPSPASPYRREEGGGARGMLRIATPCTSTAQPALHSSGCLQAAEHAHLTPGVKRLMKGVVRGIKALQVGWRQRQLAASVPPPAPAFPAAAAAKPAFLASQP